MSFFIFLFGLLVGSFLNCLVYRLNQEENLLSFFKGRSYCPKCKKKLAWFDNLPLLSFSFLKGHCRYCHSPISWRYPFSELLTGVFSLLIWQLSGRIFNLDLIFILFLFYIFIALFLSDLFYRTLPDQITYPALALTLILILFNKNYLNILIGLASAAFFLFLVLATKEKGMGWGDVKLAGLMGLFLGFPKTLIAFYLAFLTGAMVGAILVLSKKKRFKSEIAFGPFLTGATFIAFFWGERIWRIFLQ